MTPAETVVELGPLHLTEAWVMEYLAAVGDAQAIYAQRRQVPPLAVAARVLGLLLEKLHLPPGAIHSLQDVDALAPISWCETLRGASQAGKPRRRGELTFLTIAYTLENAGGTPVLSGKTTVLLPGAAS